MKQILLMIAVVALVGCGTIQPAKQLTPKDVIGTYKNPTNPNRTLVILGNGTAEIHIDGKKSELPGSHAKWTIHGREVHLIAVAPANSTEELRREIKKIGLTQIYRIKIFEFDLITVELIANGKRISMPKRRFIKVLGNTK